MCVVQHLMKITQWAVDFLRYTEICINCFLKNSKTYVDGAWGQDKIQVSHSYSLSEIAQSSNSLYFVGRLGSK